MDSEGCLEKQPKEEKLFQIPIEMRNKRILVVDDNKTNLDILIGYLVAWGFSCDAARDGEMALSMMRALAEVDAPFDLVITDMRMPEMDGAELGRRIKQDPELRETQLIMLTSLDARSEAAMLKGIGFSACLTKPVRRSKLFDSLSAVLGHRKENAPEKRSRLIAPPSAGDIHRRKHAFCWPKTIPSTANWHCTCLKN